MGYQVAQHAVILHLCQAEHGVVHTAVFGSHFIDDASYVTQLRDVFFLGPEVLAVGEKLLVGLAFVVNGIKKIFDIVEAYHDLVLRCG